MFYEVLYTLCVKHLFATLCTSFKRMLSVIMESHANESSLTHENFSQPIKIAAFR